jgi:hypothetical protein
MAWYNISWNYRRSITVSSGSALTNYQVLVTVDTASLVTASKMQSSCNDIRFTSSDGTTLINYWIESGVNSSSTRIWINIPSILSGANTIYMYYGNSSATYDNSTGGTNTFISFFDGNSTGWTKVDPGGFLSFTNNRLDWTNWGRQNSYIYKQQILPTNFIVECTWRATSTVQYGTFEPFAYTDSLGGLVQTVYGYHNWYQHPYGNLMKRVNSVASFDTDMPAATANTQYWDRYTLVSGVQTHKIYTDSTFTTVLGTSTLSSTDVVTTNIKYVYLIQQQGGGDNNWLSTGWLDDWRIRQYTATEPTTCVGGEEVQTVSWLSGWDRRKLLTITGSTSGAQTDYQMKLIVHKATGSDTSTDIYLGANVNNDFSDLRFTSNDGSTNLNYWIESYTSGSVATVWIKIPSIPTNPCTSTIYIYYNNTGASSASNGTNTFIAFNHYLVNEGGWTKVDPTSSFTQDYITNHRLDFTNWAARNSVGYIYRSIPTTSDFILNVTFLVSPTVWGALAVLGFADTINEMNTINNGLFIEEYSGNGYEIQNPILGISHWTSGTESAWYPTYTTNISANTVYYLTFTRLGTSVKLYIY